MTQRFHNSYTSDDERLLVKYIAKYNPHGVGRSGNVLYKTLVDNEQRKWSWAKRHPWQSWRDRYCKNKDWYEKQIRIYQKKHGIDVTHPKASPATQQKRARDDGGDSESGEDVREEKDARMRKRHKAREVRERAEMGRERRDRLKEEEEEEEEEEGNDMGEGTSKGARGRGAMPVSTVKKEKVEPQVADDVTHAKPKEDGNPAVEEQDADNEDSDEDGNQEPVGPDDYQGGIFGSSEDEIGETEVNQLTDANVQSETEEEMDAQEVDQQLIAPSKPESSRSSPRDKLDEPSDNREPLYPAIESVPSPHLRASQPAEPQVPGAYAVPPMASPPASLPPRRHPPAYAQAYPLLQRAILAADEDFFESRPSTPTPAPQNENVARGTTRTRPPKLVEGPYGNSFAGTRRSGRGEGSGTESEDEGKKRKEHEAWPPQRRHTLSGTGGGQKGKEKDVGDSKVIDTGNAIDKDKGKQKQKVIPVTSTSIDVEAKKLLQAVPPPAQRPRPPPQVNAQASSSRMLLSDLPPPLPAPALPLDAHRVALPARTVDPRTHHPFEPGATTKHVITTRQAVADAPFSVNEATRPDPPVSNGREDGTPQIGGQVQKHRGPITNGKSARTNGETIPTLPSRLTRNGSSKRQASSLRKEMNFAMPSESWTPGNPFVERPPVQTNMNDKAKKVKQQKRKAHDDFGRRHTIGNLLPRSEVSSEGRRIDLREELARSIGGVRMRRSLPLRSRTASLRSTPDSGRLGGRSVSPRAGTPLLALPRTEEDFATVQLLGVSSALSMIAKNTSFSEETVMRVWQAMGSIARTEEYFNRLKSAVGEASEQIYEAMEREKEQREKDQGRGSDSESGSSPERIDVGRRISSSPRRSVNSERQNLNIRPLPRDDGDEVLSDYSPPHTSRAGQYTRLVKQGRREEALTREGRRASLGGGGVLLPKEMSHDEEVPRTRSPTAEIGSEPQWGDEEEGAFMSASAENAHVLREIESLMAPEFMRRWTAMHLMRLRKNFQS